VRATVSMRTSCSALTLVALALPAAASATDLPFEVRRQDARRGEMELALRPSAIAAIAALQRAELTEFPLTNGERVALRLERIDLTQLAFGIQVDGSPAPGLLDGLDLSVWRGKVVGEADSQVALSFSLEGIHGWVLARGELNHLMSRGPSEVWMVSERRLIELGGEGGIRCASDELAQNMRAPREAPSVGGSKAYAPSLYVCPMAIETDYQLHQVFNNNLQAQSAYVASLLAWASYRYEEQIGTVLTYPYVQFYTTPNDPWISQDNGGDCIDVLFEFQAAWAGNVPAGAKIAHFLSGVDIDCGVGFFPGLCSEPWNFSVSGHINGTMSFPVQVSPSNWDFLVCTHEVGHNFNAPHTHEYCPPLDECAPAPNFGPCQTQQVCTNQGTLMSACHLCPGGLLNDTMYFHPASAADMRAWVEATCLPLYAPDPIPYCTPKLNSKGCLPRIGWSGHPTLSGLDDFVETAELVINNKNGLLFHGQSAASVPFQGGTLCVGAPVKRTPVQSSGGNPPPNDCSGTYAYHWTPTQLGLFGAGTTVYTQWWYRDPLSPSSTGLTDALSFTVFN
jgi:Metallo-peptidase family M12